MRLIIEGLPPALNARTSISKTGARYTTASTKAYQEAVALQAKVQHQGEPLQGQLAVLYVVEVPNGRRDWDASYKDTQDALSGIVWGDDRQIALGMASINNRGTEARTVVLVEPLRNLSKLLAAASAVGGALVRED